MYNRGDRPPEFEYERSLSHNQKVRESGVKSEPPRSWTPYTSPMRARMRGRVAAGMVAIGLVLTGCGSSGASRPVAHSPSAVPQPSDTTAPHSPAASPTPSSAQSDEPSPFGTRPSLPLDPRNKGSKV